MMELSFHPVTVERLPDLHRFAEEHGKFRYCSCMRWRMPSSEYQRSTKSSREAALATLVRADVPVGVLAYVGEDPIGWCSVAPRQTYVALERYKRLSRLDDAPVWSVVCFFVDRRHRGQGVAVGLLRAALAYAHSRGAKIVEGYPVERGPWLYTYMGSPSAFEKAGFIDVTPPGRERRVMRHTDPAIALEAGRRRLDC